MPSDVAERWFRTLRRQALAQFETQALSGALEAMDLQRATAAHRQLLSFLGGHSKGSKTIRQFAADGGFALKQPAAEAVANKEGMS
jgi:CRISPR system Cascade subunit CasA